MTGSPINVPKLAGFSERVANLNRVSRAILGNDDLLGCTISLCKMSEDGKSLTLKKYFHIGVAVDGPLGLLVPVLRDVEANRVVRVGR